MYKGLPSHAGMSSDIFNKFDLVCSGHYHHRSKHKNIQYLGAAMEYTWSDAEDARGFSVFDTKSCQLEFIDNPLRIFYKIFYDDTVKKFSSDIKHGMYKIYSINSLKI